MNALSRSVNLIQRKASANLLLNTNSRNANANLLLNTKKRFSSKLSSVNKQMKTALKEPDMKETWLMDPGTYPIVFILGFALCFCAAVGTTCLRKNPDVRITKEKRASFLRTWEF
uniref:Uncharacterized protein n=1 Tax=Proboscia inermis TaxID=420281 RepID=A0A7S0CLA5_9STRA|mmetsp:Transcript_64741/g.76005  ORF Transcript_64741/g.76005 Transcript_64741/m.76005 type:complete len:115 (+) Transcript_64741:55-399(+)